MEKQGETTLKRTPIGGWRSLAITLKKSWGLFRRSKLGLAGTGIIAIFTFMAIFAPVIAPFTPEFLAPDIDVFAPVSYSKIFNNSLGQVYEPVVGPSAPKNPLQAGGRLWIIMAHESGLIEMDALTRNLDPFDPAEETLTLNIADFGLSTPISNVLYIAPGAASLTDNVSKSGLLAFVANKRFILLNPFTSRIRWNSDLGFQPTWFVQDPVSSGDMYEYPQLINNHTWRYVVAANETHLTCFRVDFRSSQDDPELRGMDIIINTDIAVTGPPLSYYIQLQEQFSGIFVPTTDNKLAVFSINGTVWTNVSLDLDGEPANVTAPIGFYRAPEITMLYVPLKCANKAGIGYMQPRNTGTGDVRFPYHLVINGTDVTVTSQPDPGNADKPFFVLTHYESGNPTYSELLAGTADGRLDPILSVGLQKPVISFLFSPTTSQVLALDSEGTVWSHPTVSLSTLRQGLIDFLHNSDLPDKDTNRKSIQYMGSVGGAKYSIQVSSEETSALIFEPSTGKVTVVKLIGVSIAPLPPGTYPSGNTYWLGTDEKGGDLLTQLIYGSRVALEVGVAAAFFAVLIGTLLGLIAGFYGGILDTILMRITDIALVLPFLPLVLILAAILGPSILNIIITIAILGWPGIARVIRAQTLSLKERPFVDAARIAGASRARTMLIHIAPNVLPFAFLYMTLNVGGAILTEAAVSFLGLGDPRPSAISWGIMLRTIQSSGNTLSAWWWLLPPGLCITLVSLGFYLVGRAIDDIVNPRLRQR